MHELSVTENILEIALRHAQEANAHKILKIYLVIGEMASIIDDSVQFYWDMIVKDTIAEKSSLIFNRLPAIFTCMDCGHDYSFKGEYLLCPNCSSVKVKLVSGDQFFLEAIDVE